MQGHLGLFICHGKTIAERWQGGTPASSSLPAVHAAIGRKRQLCTPLQMEMLDLCVCKRYMCAHEHYGLCARTRRNTPSDDLQSAGEFALDHTPQHLASWPWEPQASP